MKLINKFFVLLAFVYWLVPIYLNIFPGWLNSGIYNGIPLLYLAWNYNDVQSLLNNVKKDFLYLSMLLFFMAVIWSFVVVACNGTSDYSYFRKLFEVARAIYIAMFLLILVNKTMNEYCMIEKYSIYYAGAIAICVLFTIVTLLSAEFRNYYVDLLNPPEIPGLLENKSYITRFSVGGFAGFGQTILASIAGMLSYYLICKRIYIGYLLLVMSFLGNMFYGRIGILLSLVAIAFLLLNTVKLSNLFGIVLGIFILITVFICLFDNPMLEPWKMWLMQPIEAFLQGVKNGQLSLGSSGDTLIYNMYFMPDECTLLFGDGKYDNGDGSYYMHTDAGYMRIVLYFGVTGALMMYGSYLALTVFALKNLPRNKLARHLVFALLICFFISEYKGDPYPIYFGSLFAISLSGERRDSIIPMKKNTSCNIE